jgi:UDP-N-acetylglucosamine diphosphorylase/glucosamine-1-phosphate N-acetyltransferase
VQVVLFEDEFVDRLAPVAAAEPAFAVTCGSYKLVYLERTLGPSLSVIRKHLRPLEAASYPDRVPTGKPLAGPVLFVNARLVPSASIKSQLKRFADAGQEAAIISGQSIAVALVKQCDFQLTADTEPAALVNYLRSRNLPTVNVELPLIDWPHDLVRHHMACCRENLEHRLENEGYREVRPGLFVAQNVTLGEHLVIDAKNGPVLVDHDATIGAFSYLRGPVYIGPKAKVNEHASLKDCVSLGHNTKVGGEVEASIIEPYSNKQHHGFLGHSYVGSWVNLGAGTTNSDLKNTYGPVNMQYGSEKISTGMQFVGSFIGDYVKTAINTAIFTGKTIGVCSMLYGYVAANVPAFCNYAKSLGQVTDLNVEEMIKVQQRMFSRRGLEQRPCDIQLLRDLYRQAEQTRQLSKEPLVLG